MPRTKSIAARKHRKIRASAKGYRFSASRRVKTAKEAILHAGNYSFAGRKARRRNIRKLWIIRLNAAARENAITYAKLMSGLKKAGIELDRKVLADIAVSDPSTFAKIAKRATKGLGVETSFTEK
ncbi:50S ribosomal protein L20 [Candidatus Woesebacteria bacterium RIFCSPHIGHO2_01_FULL_41_10]|uniref:Large ribosomal subunit protein bL20 n=1 Tax=Candidatus Woesebacteria bacterium RIFCSPHIGHO2_01_FULL_41_10 TaxID=1802500 RepID=A0A1F7YNH0_9BACT|nr:MAG: 50S ribosomal protein L20 [Candidatus Woesebacteria bacterium RIFCSPHIGHO2_01_FULL_41_10]